MPVDVVVTTVMPFLQASAVTGRRSGATPSAMCVPGASGLMVLRMRTGMFLAAAGWMDFGCSTFAPKYASSAASANERYGTSFGPSTTRGSAVSMPSTSVQIWISSASSAAPMSAAE